MSRLEYCIYNILLYSTVLYKITMHTQLYFADYPTVTEGNIDDVQYSKLFLKKAAVDMLITVDNTVCHSKSSHWCFVDTVTVYTE